MRTFLIACLFFAGCQAVPVAPPPTHFVRLFDRDLPAEEAVLQEVLTERIPQGATLDEAEAHFREQGFGVARFTMGKGLMKRIEGQSGEPNRHHRCRYCAIQRDLLDKWGQEYAELKVILCPDEANGFAEMIVTVWQRPHPNRDFFARHPELKEPGGLPLAEAQARMEAAGFRCSLKNKRSQLHCEAKDEAALGGQIVRVKLFLDLADKVRDSEVVLEQGWFDAERCLLPDPADTTAEKVADTLLFPVRIGCRYTIVLFLHGLAAGMMINN